MRFALLGSGSKGNATLVEKGSTHLLIDNGFSLRELERRLGRIGREAGDLSAILVTHEHSDHISGVGALARKYRIPVWMTPGTWKRQRTGEVPKISLFNCHQDFIINDIQVHPFPVPHDAREPAQFVFSDGAKRLGILTDSGTVTPHIEAQLDGCDALILECNHDDEMLRTGPYPMVLKMRVGGDLGHLSNDQAEAVLNDIDSSRLQHLIAAHLSEKNNLPALACEALSRGLGCETHWIALADQDDGLDWREIT
jgi:phosphoribosyl 1,2-cyclic phosphodiesterase